MMGIETKQTLGLYRNCATRQLQVDVSCAQPDDNGEAHPRAASIKFKLSKSKHSRPSVCSLLLCDFSTRKAIDNRNIVPPVAKVEPSRLPLGHAFEAVVRAKWKFFQPLDSYPGVDEGVNHI
jgi:hypothetical protein